MGVGEAEMNDDMNHMLFLDKVTTEDVQCLQEKEKTYQGSWKRRGGIGAAMMILRKVDRLEIILKNNNYDIFKALENGIGEDGSALAEVRDLRRYLLLCEAEMLSRDAAELPMTKRWTREVENQSAPMIEKQLRGAVHNDLSDLLRPGTPEDGGHHAQQPECLEERLEDGLPWEDIPCDQRYLYMPVSLPDSWDRYIVDRRKVPAADREHLPQLQRELNNQEWIEIEAGYKGLYHWHETSSKWILKSDYQQWCKE